MTNEQMVHVVLAIALILVIALLAQFKWLPRGKPKLVLVFLAGSAAMGLLWIAELPPTWFSASKEGFGLSVSFLIGSMLGSSNPEEVTFRRPFFLGIGLTLLIANLVQAVKNVL